MNKILVFFASLINGVGSGNNYILSIAGIAVLAKLLLFIPSSKYYKNIKLSDILQPKIDKIRDKHKKHPEKANEEISKLVMQSGYSVAGGIFSVIFNGVIAIMLALVFKDVNIYLPEASEGALSFIGINITKSTTTLFLNSEYASFAPMALFLAIACIALQVYHDKLMDKNMIVDLSIFYKVVWGVVSICGLFLPEAFVVYWVVCKVLDLLMYFYTLKFTNISEKQVDTTIESTKRKMNSK